MKSVILAAGVGKRLGAVTGNRPKCLLEVGGRSLLARYLDALVDVGIKSAVLVVGHRQELIRAAIGDAYRGLALRYIVNDQYRRGSLYSLWLARATFDDDLLIMDADVLCPASFVKRLVNAPHPNAILIDETVRQDSEERMAVIRGGRVMALTKQRSTQPADLLGEGVGFLKVTRRDSEALVAAMEPFVARGELDMEYEDTWEAFFQAVPVGYEKVGGQPWIEIDFPGDITRAEREILPRITELEKSTA
ncbi:MAG: phosphocholine cytidylyltransferase family protein [Nitrospirota bacterium]